MFYRGRTEIIMCESTAYQYRRDSTYTVPYVPTIAFCANARPRTLGTLPDDASRLMRGVTTHRLVGLRPPPCVVPPRKPVGFRQRTETRKPPSWHTIMYCVKGVNQKSFSGSKAVAVRTPVRTSSCQSLFLESSAAGCPPGGRALQGGPAVLGRVAASAITVWKSAL